MGMRVKHPAHAWCKAGDEHTRFVAVVITVGACLTLRDVALESDTLGRASALMLLAVSGHST